MRSNKLAKLILVLSIVVIPNLSQSQTLKEATEAYNTGATLLQDKKPKEALGYLYNALALSEELEFEGTEIKRNTEDIIPTAHFQNAMNLYREKDMNGTLEQLEKAQETAHSYGDRKTLGRVETIIPQLYNQMGNTEYRADNFEKAINYYEKAIGIKTDYSDPYLGIALSMEKQENFDGMLEYLRKTMDVSLQTNDRNKADDAQKKAKAYLLLKGDEAQKVKSFEEAISYFKKALEFDELDGTIYYVLAVNNSELKEWEKVIEFSKLALEKANGNLDEAGIYYQMGVAFQNQGDTTEACQAFTNALSGAYRAAAEYQMKEVLKCK